MQRRQTTVATVATVATIATMAFAIIGCGSGENQAQNQNELASTRVKSPTPASHDATSVAPTPSDSPPLRPAPKRVACSSNSDCMNSCSQGAVSKTWWKATFPGNEGCEDGCADASIAQPRCENDRCVSYRHDGKRSAECTDVDRAPDAVGPAHWCDSASDCKNTCAYGAVNRTWHKHHGKKGCKGGCVSKGTDAPTCEANLCVANKNGKPNASCTRRSIW